MPRGFRITRRRIDSKNVPRITFEWDAHRDPWHSQPQLYEILVSSDHLYAWRNVSSPVEVVILPYVKTNVTLRAMNCIGRNSTSMIVHTGT